MFGWLIPPLGLSPKGRKRLRKKNNGYLLPFITPGGDNTGCIKYGLESGSLQVQVPLGFFDAATLLWWKGATPINEDAVPSLDSNSTNMMRTRGKKTAKPEAVRDDDVARFDMVTRRPKSPNTTFTVGRVQDFFYVD